MVLARAEEDRLRVRLLSKIGAMAGSLDPIRVLDGIAHLCVPELADYSLIDSVDGDQIHRVKLVYRFPEMAVAAAELERMPALWALDPAASRRLRSGQSMVIHDLADVLNVPGARAYAFRPEQLAALRIGVPLSLMLVPLMSEGRLAAVLVIGTTDHSGRRFEENDLALAEELARRAAQLVENARLHQRLRQNERRVRLALEHSNVALFEQDNEEILRWVYNPPLGLHPDQLIGRRMRDLAGFRIRPRIDEMFERVLGSGQRVRAEMTITHEGEAHEFLVDVDLLRDEAGHVVGIAGAATEITAEKQAQRELAESLQFREELLGILAHEMRTPLSAVILSAQLLEREGENARRQALRIGDTARRMNELIGRLLDFARSRFQGPLPLERRACHLGEIVARVREELSASHPDRVIAVELDGELRGNWDAARLHQVLSNLLSNALHHGAPDGKVTLRAWSEGDTQALSVHNRGAPIPPSLLPVVFEPFRRGEHDREPSGKSGLGLGLYIARQIVLAHGGTIDVQSTERDGTTFTVRLPRS